MTARVELDRDGPVLVITFVVDDPGRFPAYDGATLHQLAAAGAELDGHPSLRAAPSSPDYSATTRLSL